MSKSQNFKLVLKAFVFITCLFTSLTPSFSQTLEEKAKHKIDMLHVKIHVAEASQLYVEREKMTMRTAEIFLKYADWDEKNTELNASFFGELKNYRGNADELANQLADYERSQVIKILDEALLNITALIDGSHKRKNIPKLDYAQTELHGNTVLQDGRPVFLADHVWKPGIPELNEFFGALDKDYITTGWIENKKGDIDKDVLKEFDEKQSTRMGFVFLDHNRPPGWAYKQYENFDVGARHYGTFDIDHPGARQLYADLFKHLAPRMADKKVTDLGYMLFNEPSFFTEEGVWNTGVVSDYTKDKFEFWLEKKHGSIENLNAIWKTRYKSFDAINVTIPIKSELQGTPIWYDWMIFNNYRVTEWFRFLKQEIRKYDADVPVHIKLMPWLWTKEKKDHGMDFESLIRLCDISGSDAQAYNSNMSGTPELWMDKYAFEWKHLSMPYDFFRSIRPNQIILDSESHFLSTVRFRDLYLQPEYVRAVYWLAHVHGLNVSTNWVWSRNEEGAVKASKGKGHAGSNMMQPAVLNEMHATMIDLNSFSEEITAMQQQRKPLRIYYSLANAIQRKTYMDDVHATYESLYFEGVPLGFATDSILIEENHEDWDAVIIRNTEIVTDQEFRTLQNYLKKGGTILIDNFSLKQNEYKKAHPKLKTGRGLIIYTNSPEHAKIKAMEIVKANDSAPIVTLNQKNNAGSKTCFWRCIQNKDGNPVVSVINLGHSEAMIEIRTKSKELMLKNLLNATGMGPINTLKPYEVLFVEVVD